MDSATWPSNPTQQFCLRWHNHQNSLLTTLPLLLDQSSLTDVTLSAEGRTVKAHRVVLSACSTFFLELFQTVEPPFHPVIVLPGASFSTMVALLTFMYSGEVNVYEEQISGLLSLAETLGIKGLADFNGNITASSPKPETPQPKENKDTELSPPILNPTKINSSLENLFAKTFPFCSTMMTHPFNFTQSAISRGAELLARYQSTCGRPNNFDKNRPATDENGNNQRMMSSETKKHKTIDKIAENLRTVNTNSGDAEKTSNILTRQSSAPSSSSSSSSANIKQELNQANQMANFISDATSKLLDQMPLGQQQQQQLLTAAAASIDSNTESLIVDKPTVPKTATSKLYATCFICHKQLSNQYNLRVHLETHQNVRYACNVCSHVSRSKDALRKHVSYRHPGTQTICDSEIRRKRSKPAHIDTHNMASSSSSDKSYQLMSLPQFSAATECVMSEHSTSNDKDKSILIGSVDPFEDATMEPSRPPK